MIFNARATREHGSALKKAKRPDGYRLLIPGQGCLSSVERNMKNREAGLKVKAPTEWKLNASSVEPNPSRSRADTIWPVLST